MEAEKTVVFGRRVWRRLEDEKCGGAEAMEAMEVKFKPIPPQLTQSS